MRDLCNVEPWLCYVFWIEYFYGLMMLSLMWKLLVLLCPGYERGLRFLGRARAAALRGFTFGEEAVMLSFSSSANNFLTGSTRDIRGKGVS